MKLPYLYLCGPMTGLPDDNYPAFHAAAAKLRTAGYDVTNPAENSLPKGSPWVQYMTFNVLRMMDNCEAIAYLPGHEASKGARIEIALATGLGWRVQPVATWLAEVQAAQAPDAARIRAELLCYLQRDLLAILKKPRNFMEQYTAAEHNEVLDLRARIHALNPEAALYFNHGGPRPYHIPEPTTAAQKSALWWSSRFPNAHTATNPADHDS
jgi:hypothetical protein